MKVKMRKKIVRKVERKLQRKEMYSTTIWKMLMERILFKKLPQVVIAKSVM